MNFLQMLAGLHELVRASSARKLQAGFHHQRHASKSRTNNDPCPLCGVTMNGTRCFNRACKANEREETPLPPAGRRHGHGATMEIAERVFDRGRNVLTSEEHVVLSHFFLKEHRVDDINYFVYRRQPAAERLLIRIWVAAR